MKMNKLKKTISIITILFMLSTLLKFNKVEAASVSLTGDKTITMGQSIQITASATAWTWNLHLSGNGQSRDLVDTTEEKANITKSVTLTFTPSAPGTYTFKLTGDVSDYVTEATEYVNKTCTITVNPAPANDPTPTSGGGSGSSQGGSSSNQGGSSNNNKSNNNNNNNSQTDTSKSKNNHLSSLTVNTGSLEPGFHRETMDYTLKLPDNFDYSSFNSLRVSASAEDSKAKITGTGEIAINEGENNIQVVVTAENGTVRTYNIKVVKEKPITQSDLRLSQLTVNAIDEENNFIKVDLDKDFDPEVFEYNLDVDENIKALDVNAMASGDGMIVNVDGGQELEEGENLVTITLTSQKDSSVQTVYKIHVNKAMTEEVVAELKDDENAGKSKKAIIIGLVVLVVILLITFIVLFIINRKKKKSGMAYSRKYEGFDNEINNFVDYNTTDEGNVFVEDKIELIDDGDFEEYEKPDEKEIDISEKGRGRKPKGKHF